MQLDSLNCVYFHFNRHRDGNQFDTTDCQLQAKRQTMKIRCRLRGLSTFITNKSPQSDEKNVRFCAAGNILWLANDSLV